MVGGCLGQWKERGKESGEVENKVEKNRKEILPSRGNERYYWMKGEWERGFSTTRRRLVVIRYFSKERREREERKNERRMRVCMNG